MITQISSIDILESEQGIRLDKLLSIRFPSFSRAYFQTLIAAEKITVNQKHVKKDYAVRFGDHVIIQHEIKEEVVLVPDTNVPFFVVYEEKDFAVIEKPAGITVHPSDTQIHGTLAGGILAKWPEISGVGEDDLRPGIVHRLDKETSGLMVIAKTQEMFVWLKKQFQDRRVEKKYITLVFGKVRQRKGEITVSIARSGIKQIADIRGSAINARHAITQYTVMGYYQNKTSIFTLVEVMPKTGRMHQIRVHMKHIGHAVVEDKKYASVKLRSLLPCSRQFLHASSLSFFLPNGIKKLFSLKLPVDLQDVLDSLQKLAK